MCWDGVGVTGMVWVCVEMVWVCVEMVWVCAGVMCVLGRGCMCAVMEVIDATLHIPLSPLPSLCRNGFYT